MARTCTPRGAAHASLTAIADLIGSVDGLPSDLTARRRSICRQGVIGQKRLVTLDLFVTLLSSRALTTMGLDGKPLNASALVHVRAVLSGLSTFSEACRPNLAHYFDAALCRSPSHLPERGAVVKLIEKYSNVHWASPMLASFA